jgi:hypothetical protein
MWGRSICSLQGRCFHITSRLTSVFILTEWSLHSARRDKDRFVTIPEPSKFSALQVSVKPSICISLALLVYYGLLNCPHLSAAKSKGNGI